MAYSNAIYEPDIERYEALYADQPRATCWTYEVWDTFGRLAYVGVADDFDRRWQQHSAKSWWLNEIRVERIYVEGYRTRREARLSEAVVINTQNPVYNTNAETRSYLEYRRIMDGPDPFADELFLSPVKKRYFKGVEVALVQG